MLNLLVIAQQAAEAVPVPQAAAAASSGLSLGQQFMLFLYAVVCVGLVGCVLKQDSKSDGLGGMMGGGQANFRGKKSDEEKLATVTGYLAGAFIVMSLVMSQMFHT